MDGRMDRQIKNQRKLKSDTVVDFLEGRGERKRDRERMNIISSQTL